MFEISPTKPGRSELPPFRRVRIFLSSTFHDMQQEREELVKNVFPQLMSTFLRRGIFLTVIDLRWGITEAQALRRKVVPICLSEVDACRPYFIALLGERYGWVPENFTRDVLRNHTWINHRPGMSLTEIEIRHGALNNLGLSKNCYFYIRDRAYIETIDKDRRHAFQEHDPALRKKLKALKQEIRKSGLRLFDDYKTPKQAAQQIMVDLSKLLDEEFPPVELVESNRVKLWQMNMDEDDSGGIPRRTWEQYRLKGAVFSNSIGPVFAGRTQYLQCLDSFAVSSKKALVIEGEKGIGKSALVKQWSECYRARAQHSKACVVVHVGYPLDNINNIRGYIAWELGEEIGWEHPFDRASPLSQREFVETLRKINKQVSPIVIIDGFDKITDVLVDPFEWLSTAQTEGTRFVLTRTKNTRTPRENSERCVVELEGLTEVEKKEIIVKYFALSGKTLDNGHIERIMQAKVTSNPAYLNKILEELRIFGKYEELDSVITDYENAGNYQSLYHKILNRLEQDYRRDNRNLIAELFSGIGCAQTKCLSENELMQLLGLTSLDWSEIYHGTGVLFEVRDGLLGCRDPSLEKTVNERYLATEKTRIETHNRLADMFASQPAGYRKAIELPHHLRHIHDWERLKASLLDPGLFRWFKESKFLSYIEVLRPHFDLNAEYVATINKLPAPDMLDMYYKPQFADLLQRVGLSAAAESLLRACLRWNDIKAGPSTGFRRHVVYSLAKILAANDRRTEAKNLLRDALVEDEDIELLLYLSKFEMGDGEYGPAEQHLRRAETLAQKSTPEEPSIQGMIAHRLGNLMIRIRDYEAAEAFYIKALDLNETIDMLTTFAGFLESRHRDKDAIETWRRALQLAEKNLGINSVKTAAILNRLGSALAGNNLINEALRVLEQAVEITEQADVHVSTKATYLNDLGAVLIQAGELNKAEQALRHALFLEKPKKTNGAGCLSILINLARVLKANDQALESRALLSEAHLKVRMSETEQAALPQQLSALAELLSEFNQEEAEAVFEAAVNAATMNEDTDRVQLADILHSQANFMRNTGRIQLAEELYERALRLYKEEGLDRSATVGSVLADRAWLQLFSHRYEESQGYYRRAQDILEGIGIEDERLGPVLYGIGMLYSFTGQLEQAENYLTRALMIYEQYKGPEDGHLAMVFGGMGMLQQERGDVEEALVNFQRSHNILVRLHGPKHGSIATVLAHIGHLHLRAGRHNEARRFYKRALSIAENNSPMYIRLTAQLLNGLSIAEQARGAFDKALLLNKRSLLITKRNEGANSPNIVKRLKTRSEILASMGDVKQARKVLRHAMNIICEEDSSDPRYIDLAKQLKKLEKI